MDMVYRGKMEPDRDHALTTLPPETIAWLQASGFAPKDPALWLEALTHGSTGRKPDYQRLEFLGDRVLGLAIAEWLHQLTIGDEGKLAQRLNALVSKRACADVARAIQAGPHIHMDKQARDSGGADSDNILGDVMESLLGAAFVEHGYEMARGLVRTLWRSAVEGGTGKRKHPKSALQEWAAGNQMRLPEYSIVDRSGPDHAAKYTVRVHIHKVGEAEATASSKSEAERLAAAKFMEQFG